MTDEIQLQQAASRGSRAKALLENELFIEAIDILERQYIASWRVTGIHATEDREKLFLAVNILGKIKDQIGMVAANGTMAEKELAALAEQVKRAAERNRRFGIV